MKGPCEYRDEAPSRRGDGSPRILYSLRLAVNVQVVAQLPRVYEEPLNAGKGCCTPDFCIARTRLPTTGFSVTSGRVGGREVDCVIVSTGFSPICSINVVRVVLEVGCAFVYADAKK